MSRWTKQTKFGTEGNCLAACLASLFGVPIDEAQPVSDISIKGEGGWAKALMDWSHARGYSWANIHPAFAGLLYPSLFIGVGPSPRELGHRHAVIMRGQQLFFDPHPDDAGLKNGKLEECWIFVPHDPLTPNARNEPPQL